jgi:energy-coupling factor transporter ATP-binding protein EcfA2
MEADRRRRELAIERATIVLGQTRAGAVRKVREEERQQKEEERRQKEDERRQGEEDNRIEREKLFHFASIGKSGCGKSSLINAFRNLRNNDAGASEAGTTETTLEIGRYPAGCWDGASPKQDGMVWYSGRWHAAHSSPRLLCQAGAVYV